MDVKSQVHRFFSWLEYFGTFANCCCVSLKYKYTVSQGDSSDLEVDASNVPEQSVEETQAGLTRYYLQAISRTFGFGARVFWGTERERIIWRVFQQRILVLSVLKVFNPGFYRWSWALLFKLLKKVLIVFLKLLSSVFSGPIYRLLVSKQNYNLNILMV